MNPLTDNNTTNEKYNKYKETKNRRNTQPLPRRLANLLTKNALLIQGKTSNLQPHINTTKTAQPPPQTAESPIQTQLQIITAAIQTAEEELDRQNGLLPNLSIGHQRTTAELDAELKTRWEGYDSGLISLLAPYLGSQRTIERARVRLGLRPIDGTQLTNN